MDALKALGAETTKVLSSVNADVIPISKCILSSGLPACYVKHNSLSLSYYLMLVIAAYSLIWSIVGKNCSKVDQIWSITPWAYIWHFYLHNAITESLPCDRLFIVCLLTTCWGLRLTFNFARRGGYGNFFTHEEDYRWPILRKMMNPFLFLIFNITFIAFYQNFLLWLIAVPAYEALVSGPASLCDWDIMLTLVFMLLLIGETIADQQHYDYQEYKHSLSLSERLKSSDPDIKNGFLTKGLFFLCRHPNYFCEQSIWVVIFAFSAIGKDGTFSNVSNWTVLGAVLLLLLFQGSMAFSEGITARKYPLYSVYQKEVSQCFPLPFHFASAGKKKSN